MRIKVLKIKAMINKITRLLGMRFRSALTTKVSMIMPRTRYMEISRSVSIG